MHFGATLKLLRVDAGFTLRQLAERIGVSNAYLSRVENGHDAPPTPDRLAALAHALAVPPTMLVGLADRVGPVAEDYFEHVPAARDLMLEVIRRKLGPIDIARIRAFVEKEFPVDAPSRSRAAAEMLDPKRVVLDLACAHIEDAIDVAATRLAVRGGASAATIAHAILTREATCSTAVGGGLAIPHANVGEAARAVVITLRRPLSTATPDGKPLTMLVVHVHGGPPMHTVVLAQLARLADPALLAPVIAARGPEPVIAALRAALATA